MHDCDVPCLYIYASGIGLVCGAQAQHLARTMTTRPRISPLDFDVGHDEELPGYEESDAPAYESGTYDDPFITYHLRQYDRKIQILVAHGMSSSTSYRITTNGFRLFSKKPEMEILYTSHEMRQRSVGSISFDSDGPLPWRPRAHFDYIDAGGKHTNYPMESVNFADWTFSVDDRTYAWTLDMSPVSLALTEFNSSVTIARFIYSSLGTSAERGAEVGELWIYRDCLTSAQEGIDKAVCGLMVALSQLKKMGKHFANGSAEPARSDSLTRNISPLQRAALAGAPTF